MKEKLKDAVVVFGMIAFVSGALWYIHSDWDSHRQKLLLELAETEEKMASCREAKCPRHQLLSLFAKRCNILVRGGRMVDERTWQEKGCAELQRRYDLQSSGLGELINHQGGNQ